jgi:NADH:ubiquinone oxidoreductase 24 kD subunit
MITVKICSGTLCYVMGGSELWTLPEVLPEGLKDKVTIKGSPCLGYCNTEKPVKAPYVEVNGRLVREASVSKIIEVIKEEIGGK